MINNPLRCDIIWHCNHKTFEADTFFPEINENDWETISKEDYKADYKNEFDYTYLILKRKNK